MTCIIAIDPGDKMSAGVCYDQICRSVVGSIYADNSEVLGWMWQQDPSQILAIEMIASYGMSVGKEVFETCVWIGRFLQAWGGPTQLVYRRDVKLHLCGSARAKDGNIRQALLDKFGGAGACGTKKARGPLYGISGDKWAALAIAVTWAEKGIE